MDEKYKLNLRVLKSHFPDVESIISTFSCVQESHLACGPLFVVKSSGRLGTFYSIVILNQSSPNDFTDEITQETEFVLATGGYVHYKKSKSSGTRYLFTEVPGEAESMYVVLGNLKHLFSNSQ